MDFLQVALIFLIIILGIFLSITGLQVFFILKDLRKTLNGLNEILFSGDEVVEEKIKQAAKKPARLTNPRPPPPGTSSRRFFKR